MADCFACAGQIDESRLLGRYADCHRDEKNRLWHNLCRQILYCERCDGKKLRGHGSRIECPACETIPRQRAEEERYRREREAQREIIAAGLARREQERWRVDFWFMIGHVGARTASADAAQRKAWLAAWTSIGAYHLKLTRWLRRWLKMWGRLGAHVRRDSHRFVNRAAFNSDDPAIRRFAQIELN